MDTKSEFEAAEIAAAKELGISPITLRLWQAAGCPIGRYADYGPVAESLAEVGQHFGVSERTAATWRSRGMPGEPGFYPLPAIASWHRDNMNGRTGQHGPAARQATGDLARAILRWLRLELVEAAAEAREDFTSVLAALSPEARADDQQVADLFTAVIAKHFERFRLDEPEIERTVAESWRIV